MNEKEFNKRNQLKIKKMSKDKSLKKLSQRWFKKSFQYEYSYHFAWLGRPIIQYPQDIIATQEIIWSLKPDLIIETGIARGGSIIFSASILELIGKGRVVGIDVDIRKQNKQKIEKHPLFKRITMLEGSSLDEKIVKKVRTLAKGKKKILVLLDSFHTLEHVCKELQLYSQFVKKGGYIIVFDTMIQDMPDYIFLKKPWNKKNNPKIAVTKFLRSNKRFIVDQELENKLLITSCPKGFLKCIR